jgi:hypothetical protein
MQNLHLLDFIAEAFRCHVHHFQCLEVPVELIAMKLVFRKRTSLQPIPPGQRSIENGARGIEKFLLKTRAI